MMFSFIGFTRLEVVAVDGLAINLNPRANAMERAAAAARELQPA